MGQLTCPLCRGDAEADIAPEVVGRHGKARVRVKGLPIRRCTYCEKSSVKYTEFLPEFVAALGRMNQLPVARKVGLLIKRPGCAKCKGSLDGAETGPVNFSRTLQLTDPNFEVDLSVLGVTCPRCSTQQVVPEGEPLEADIQQAFLNGCSAVAIHCPVTEL